MNGDEGVGPSTNSAQSIIRRLREQLNDVDEIISVLCAPLDVLGLLPPFFRARNAHPLSSNRQDVLKHLSALQEIILQVILPTWKSSLAELSAMALVDQYFCPDTISNASAMAGEVALQAYSSVLSLPLTEDSTKILINLRANYPIDRLYTAVFLRKDKTEKLNQAWEDYVQDVVSTPARVANAFGASGNVPLELEHGCYFTELCRRTEKLIQVLSNSSSRGMRYAFHINCAHDLTSDRLCYSHHIPSHKARESRSVPGFNKPYSFPSKFLRRHLTSNTAGIVQPCIYCVLANALQRNRVGVHAQDNFWFPSQRLAIHLRSHER